MISAGEDPIATFMANRQMNSGPALSGGLDYLPEFQQDLAKPDASDVRDAQSAQRAQFEQQTFTDSDYKNRKRLAKLRMLQQGGFLKEGE